MHLKFQQTVNIINRGKNGFRRNFFKTYKTRKNDGVKIPKLTKFTFELDEYWCNYFFKEKQRSIDVKYDNKIENDIEIVKFDYLRGKATFRSKLEGTEYEIDFNDIHSSDLIAEDTRLPNDLFIKLINVSNK